jgi:hypothetical protein
LNPGPDPQHRFLQKSLVAKKGLFDAKILLESQEKVFFSFASAKVVAA